MSSSVNGDKNHAYLIGLPLGLNKTMKDSAENGIWNMQQMITLIVVDCLDIIGVLSPVAFNSHVQSTNIY